MHNFAVCLITWCHVGAHWHTYPTSHRARVARQGSGDRSSLPPGIAQYARAGAWIWWFVTNICLWVHGSSVGSLCTTSHNYFWYLLILMYKPVVVFQILVYSEAPIPLLEQCTTSDHNAIAPLYFPTGGSTTSMSHLISNSVLSLKNCK